MSPTLIVRLDRLITGHKLCPGADIYPTRGSAIRIRDNNFIERTSRSEIDYPSSGRFLDGHIFCRWLIAQDNTELFSIHIRKVFREINTTRRVCRRSNPRKSSRCYINAFILEENTKLNKISIPIRQQNIISIDARQIQNGITHPDL
jgi:hypothetical protein